MYKTYDDGTNQLVALDPATRKLTVLGAPFNGKYCGASLSHAVLYQQQYYTSCCEELAFCSNASIDIFDQTSNKLVQSVNIAFEDQVNFGLFWY